MELFFEYLVGGITTGGLYVLIAVGLTLSYGVSRVTNVAHGDFAAIGAYVMVVITSGFAARTIGWLAIPLAAIVAYTLGLVLDLVLIQPITRSGYEAERRILVVTLGLSMVISNALLLGFGAKFWQVPLLVEGSTKVGGIMVLNQRLLIVFTSVTLVAALFAMLKYTRFGLAIRATSDSPVSARAMGIPVASVARKTMAIGVALAAVAGTVVAPLTSVTPAGGFAFTIKAFVVVIVGGLGNVGGAVVAGFLLGVVESMSIWLLPTEVANVIGPIAMLVVILTRPHGILGRKEGRY